MVDKSPMMDDTHSANGYQNMTKPQSSWLKPVVIAGVVAVLVVGGVGVAVASHKKGSDSSDASSDSGSGGGSGGGGNTPITSPTPMPGSCPPITPPNAKNITGCTALDKTCSFACKNSFYVGDYEISGSANCVDGQWQPIPACSDIEFDTAFVAVGDWGSTQPFLDEDGNPLNSPHDSNIAQDYRDGQRPGNEHYDMDYNAQENIGYLMSVFAEKYNASFVLGQGDNFYWGGVMSTDDPQWEATFENQYNEPSLNIPWLNVMGNHDYGGSNKIPIDGGKLGMIQQYEAQRDYVSPKKDQFGNPRWYLPEPDHYSMSFKSGDGTYEIEAFNLESNHAQASGHGRLEVCCQVFGYKDKDGTKGYGCNYEPCKGIKDFERGCADAGAVNSCLGHLNDLWTSGIAKFAEAHSNSKALWKVFNTHYHPRLHLGVQDGNEIYKTSNNPSAPVQMYFCGHTHGEGHEFIAYDMPEEANPPNDMLGIHVFLNGAGGGIANNLGGEEDYPTSKWWMAHYGFVGVRTNKKIARAMFFGFDFESFNGFHVARQGKAEMVHCWDIPVDATIGRSCMPEE